MSEMVERVARAICVANGDDPDKEYPVTLPGVMMSFGQWQKQWQLVQPLARAAIEAMREPTMEMRQPVESVNPWGDYLWSDDWNDPVIKAAAVWRAMIDAALATPEPPR